MQAIMGGIFTSFIFMSLCCAQISLQEYLEKPQIPQAVLSLSQKGHARIYKNKLGYDAIGVLASGRKEGWIEKTFGESESAVVTKMTHLNAPMRWSASDVAGTYASLTKKKNTAGPSITIVRGVSVSDIHKAQLGKDAIVQLASQFNYLESPGSYHVPVAAYIYDYTQGPLGAIEAAAATLHREAAVTGGKLEHALYDVFPDGNKLTAREYAHGYLNLNAMSREKMDLFAKHVGRIKILPQWAYCEASGSIQLIVPAAAPSFQGSGAPLPGSLQAHVTREIVAVQYEAIAHLAAIRSMHTSKRVPLHLTLVGQGVFNNPPGVMKEAMKRVYRTLDGYDVDVYVHAFSKDAYDLVRWAFKKAGIEDYACMSKRAFFAAT